MVVCWKGHKRGDGGGDVRGWRCNWYDVLGVVVGGYAAGREGYVRAAGRGMEDVLLGLSVRGGMCQM